MQKQTIPNSRNSSKNKQYHNLGTVLKANNTTISEQF